MQIKLPHMPFKFDSPEGRMEITVRSGPSHTEGVPSQHFAAAAAFMQSGPRALERVQLSAKGSTYRGVMQTLLEGFKVTPSSFEKESVEYRVLNALCFATGVVDLDA